MGLSHHFRSTAQHPEGLHGSDAGVVLIQVSRAFVAGQGLGTRSFLDLLLDNNQHLRAIYGSVSENVYFIYMNIT